MKLFAPLLLLSLLAGCKQQDAALLVTITGVTGQGFRIPADADMLSMDVYDGPVDILHKDWCVTVTTACPNMLPPQPGGLDQTVTLVQSGGAHPHVKINLELHQGLILVGQGQNTADFQTGSTLPVRIEIARQP